LRVPKQVKSAMKCSRVNRFFFFLNLFIFIHSFNRLTASGTPAFIENKGQITDQFHNINKDVLFLYNGKGLNIQLRKTGYSYELFKTNDLSSFTGRTIRPNKLAESKLVLHRVDIEFNNANGNREIIKENKNALLLNYITGGREISNVNSYGKVIYKNVYDNIDIEFVISDDNQFKYNIILHPGSDLNDVQFLCKGASSIKQKNGSLEFETSIAKITEEIPFSYYTDTPGENRKVDFTLDENRISFQTDHDNSRTFIIDPSTNRVWGTYFGGSSIDYCTSTGCDAANNVYIAGYSLSTSNIATTGVYQSALTGSFDAYLSKFTSNGLQVWGTYFGGSNFDIFYAIHVLPSGIVYAGGDTGSLTNVASPGAHQTIYGGGIDDAIAVKFDQNGQRLWSTYMGGTMHDIAQAITVDGNGDVILSGHTESTNGISTAGAFGTVYSQNYDVFITKFDSNGTRLWGTYYGDTGTDECYGLATDASDNIYVTGMTTSLFSMTAGSPFQNINGGNQDGYIAKFDPAGANLLWGTFYGGSGDDKGIAVEIDFATGNIYVGGNTTSPNNIAGPGAFQSSIGSADDAFLAAFNSSGARLWGTYYGGNDVDYITALILDPGKNILICGESSSSNVIASANAYQPNVASVNFYDAYFAKFSNNGQYKLGTYFGGTDNDIANGITVDGNGKIYIAGETSSTLSISTPGSHMPAYAGSMDGFLAKFCVAPEPVINPAGTYTTCVNNNYNLTATNGYTSYVWNTSAATNPLAVSGSSVAGTFYYAVTVTDSDGCDGTSDSTQVIVYLCTSIEELSRAGQLQVSPVPAADYIQLSNLDNFSGGSAELYSASGAKILTVPVNENNGRINVKDMARGLYFLRCVHGEKIIQKKIILE